MSALGRRAARPLFQAERAFSSRAVVWWYLRDIQQSMRVGFRFDNFGGRFGLLYGYRDFRY